MPRYTFKRKHTKAYEDLALFIAHLKPLGMELVSLSVSDGEITVEVTEGKRIGKKRQEHLAVFDEDATQEEIEQARKLEDG